MTYIVYKSGTGYGEFEKKEFTSLKDMNAYLNEGIRAGKILTVRAIEK